MEVPFGGGVGANSRGYRAPCINYEHFRTVDFSQYNYVSMHVLNICVRVCGLFVKQNYKSLSLLFNLDN